jgi:protein-S-isoprenylcysteine O-methyltransferase Ste14
MRMLHVIAGFFLFFELPVPFYWLILHPLNSFWRHRVRAAFWVAGLTAWTAGGVLLWIFRSHLLAATPPSPISIAAGLFLIATEIYLFWRVERELGSRRLVGHAELTGRGDMFTGGLYAHVRHPRYAVLAVWCVFALLVIRLEERELAARFGAPYVEYRKRVPAFLPRSLRRHIKS